MFLSPQPFANIFNDGMLTSPLPSNQITQIIGINLKFNAKGTGQSIPRMWLEVSVLRMGNVLCFLKLYSDIKTAEPPKTPYSRSQ